MAATIVKREVLSCVPFVIEEIIYSTLDAGAQITVAHRGPSGVEPAFVLFEVTQQADSQDIISLERDRSVDDTTNNYIYIRFNTTPGGDLTGAEVRVIMIWIKQASGGIS